MPSQSQLGQGDAKENIKNNAEQMASQIKQRASEFKGRFENYNWGYGPRLWFGVIILAFGLFFLLQNFHIFPWLDWDKLWPVILIVLGLVVLGRRHRHG
jgi:uncharacterized integral membrane protein